MPATIRALTFDAAGTLFRLSEPVGATYARAARRHGLELPVEALDAAFKRAWKSVPAPHEAPGDDPDAAEIQWWREVVGRCFTMAGSEASAAQIDKIFNDLFEEFSLPERWALFPETLETLREVRDRGFPIAVVSNFDRRFHRIANGHGITACFDAILLSSEVGRSKPHPAIFEAAAERLNTEPRSILHIGDDPEADWHGARAAGFQVFELDRPRRSLRDAVSGLDPSGHKGGNFSLHA